MLDQALIPFPIIQRISKGFRLKDHNVRENLESQQNYNVLLI